MSRGRLVLGLVAALGASWGASVARGGGEEVGSASSIAASVAFCSRVGKSTGRLYGLADSFMLEEGRRVYGVVDLRNVPPRRELVVHLLWIRPDGKDAFKKRVSLCPEEGEARLQTSLSLSPERREPGTYRLRVFLFREFLIEGTVDLNAQEPET